MKNERSPSRPQSPRPVSPSVLRQRAIEQWTKVTVSKTKSAALPNDPGDYDNTISLQVPSLQQGRGDPNRKSRWSAFSLRRQKSAEIHASSDTDEKDDEASSLSAREHMHKARDRWRKLSLHREKVLEDPLQKLRLHCIARGFCDAKKLARLFCKMDKDGSLSIDSQEFEKGLAQLGLVYTVSECEDIFDKLDKDKSGTIDFGEFLIAIKPPVPKERKNIIMKVFTKFNKTEDNVVSVSVLENLFDVSKNQQYNSGKMTKEDIFTALVRAMQGSPEQMRTQVTKEEFFNYYAAVSASVDTDIEFFQMLKQTWKLVWQTQH